MTAARKLKPQTLPPSYEQVRRRLCHMTDGMAKMDALFLTAVERGHLEKAEAADLLRLRDEVLREAGVGG